MIFGKHRKIVYILVKIKIMLNSSSSGVTNIQIGLLICSIPLTTIAFMVLKLTHIINWSWWWVLSPLWISVAIPFVLLIGWLLLALWETASYEKHIKANPNRKTSSTTDWSNLKN